MPETKGKRHRFDPWGGEFPLEEGMATHSRILAWRIPWTEEPGGLQSVGSKKLDMTEKACTSFLRGGTGKRDMCLSSFLGATGPLGFVFLPL